MGQEEQVSIAADVVVVGGGGSGLAAACSAAAAGATVILLEKNPELGGSTGRSVGSITATRTPHQVSTGISDTPQDHFEDMAKFAGPLVNRDNPVLRRVLTENVTDTVNWLLSLGVEFLGPFPEPPHRKPRMHIVLPTSRSYIFHLTRHAKRLRVDLRTGLRAERILTQGRRAVGIEARDTQGRMMQIEARRAIVLAGGDYSGSRELKTELASPMVGDTPAVNGTNTGDCQRMVREIGGEILNGDLVLGPVLRFVPPPRRRLLQRLPPHRLLTRMMKWGHRRLPASIVRPFIMSFVTTVLAPERTMLEHGARLVNSSGEMIEAEARDLAKAVARQPEGKAYIVMDDAVARRFSAWPYFVSTAPGIAYAYLPDYRRSRPDLYRRAATLDEFARMLGMPATALTQVLAGSKQSPFHALGPIKSYVVLTDGGVRVSPNLEVLTADGHTIEGLFAAGSTGQGGLLLEGHGHHLGWAFTSGRIAGRNAATYPARTGEASA